ncbi:MAG TPA: hypothetical protein EYG79_02420 [Rhodobacteraceae bacterium]|nr:hypothetical protein [Paracoccaceae bacterium]
MRIGEVPYAVYQSKQVDPGDGWVSFCDEAVARREISSAQAKLQANSVVRLTGIDAGAGHQKPARPYADPVDAHPSRYG